MQITSRPILGSTTKTVVVQWEEDEAPEAEGDRFSRKGGGRRRARIRSARLQYVWQGERWIDSSVTVRMEQELASGDWGLNRDDHVYARPEWLAKLVAECMPTSVVVHEERPA